MTKLKVKGLEVREWGATIVRLNHTHRNGVKRWEIAKIINNEKSSLSSLVMLLGHDEKNAVFMAYDTRVELGVDEDIELDFSIEKAGLWDRFNWYTSNRDPMVRIPAKLAVLSFGLGVLGVLLGALSILLSICE